MELAGAARPARTLGWGKTAHLLVGALVHSGKWRATLAAGEQQPHLVEALDATTRKRAGSPRPGGSTGCPPMCALRSRNAPSSSAASAVNSSSRTPSWTCSRSAFSAEPFMLYVCAATVERLALEVSTSTVCRSVLTPPGPGGHPSVGGS